MFHELHHDHGDMCCSSAVYHQNLTSKPLVAQLYVIVCPSIPAVGVFLVMSRCKDDTSTHLWLKCENTWKKKTHLLL